MKPTDTRQVIVDTTVQPKNVMFQADARLIHRAWERLVRRAKRAGLELRQTYVRVGKFALIQHQRYAHAKRFKRAGKALRKLKTYLGRVVRDIERQITGDEQLRAIFLWPLYQARTVMEQKQRQRGRKIYSLHAGEVECIGKGKGSQALRIRCQGIGGNDAEAASPYSATAIGPRSPRESNGAGELVCDFISAPNSHPESIETANAASAVM